MNALDVFGWIVMLVGGFVGPSVIKRCTPRWGSVVLLVMGYAAGLAVLWPEVAP